jgi:hypothetical protein
MATEAIADNTQIESDYPHNVTSLESWYRHPTSTPTTASSNGMVITAFLAMRE